MGKTADPQENMKNILLRFETAGIKPPKPRKGESRDQYFKRLTAAVKATTRGSGPNTGPWQRKGAEHESRVVEEASRRRRLELKKRKGLKSK